MIRNLTCLFSFLLLLAACKHDPQPGEILRRLAAPKQIFHLKTGRDTTITCRKGTILKFCGNTFQTTATEIVLEVQEVTNRADMIRNGLSTVTTDGHLLASEGMIYLNVRSPAGTTINPDCPVRVEMPSGNPESAELYTGEIVENSVQWGNPRPLENAEELWAPGEGKMLFNMNCASCHSKSMSENLTGPALGNIGEWYSEKWLIDFTRNPEGMIAAGDGQAVCIWNKWKPVLMNSFTHLSNRQIKAIYAFIQEESARQVVVRTAADFDCAALNGEHLHEQDAKSYLFSVYDLTWMNVDMLYAENMPEVSLLVEIEQANQYDDLAVCLVFDQNASVFLESSDAGFVFPFHPAFLPMERVQVYAVGLRNRQFYAGILPANLSHENRFRLDLAPVSEEELLKKIEALDHSVHQGID